jgi:5-hydroxyisourate hydrolase
VAGGISIHAVDVTRGLPAAGMKVVLFRMNTVLNHSLNQIAEGVLTPQGTLDHPIVQGEKIEVGTYEVVFHIGDFYRRIGYPSLDPPFLDIVPYRFGIGDIEQHYHLPLKFSPWGFSLFRGG